MADEIGFLKSKKLMVTAGGGILGFTSVVFGYIDSKTDDLNRRIDEKYETVKMYVDERHKTVENKLEKLESILVRIDDRVYELTKGRGK